MIYRKMQKSRFTGRVILLIYAEGRMLPIQKKLTLKVLSCKKLREPIGAAMKNVRC